MRLFIVLLMLGSSIFATQDILGKNFSLKSTQKLAFIGPGSLRLGVYLGLEDRIVGVEKIEQRGAKLAPYRAKIVRKKLHKKPLIGSGGPGKLPSLEALIRLKPDVIIASFVSNEHVKIIEEKTKIPVFVVSYGSGYGTSDKKLSSIKKSLFLLGELTSTQKRAKKLIDFMNEQEKKLLDLGVKHDKLYVGGVSFKGAHGITSTEGDYLPFALLGLKNALAHDKQAHLYIDLENIIRLNPPIIFLDKGGKKNIETDYKLKKPLYDKIDAFKNNNIVWLDLFNFYNTNVENCYFIAWQVAKSLGKKIDLPKHKKEVFKAFLGND